ncbi:hypothetical protein C0216_15835 [Streptomyces globosus]|uniref:Uncharacterized protein n=1 Tax=Streptomyces globosus TaxID=68209 RepID=A0A344U1F8_9ACTN|nr:hypothetical protein [Streptomyces globosus]AXE24729.1 hypothetical protein C0216_15835 [Streptomyces globosus]
MFVTENGTGTAVLLVFGGVLLLLALFGSRLEGLEVGGVSLRLRAAAADRLALAEESERQGDVASARRLRAEAQVLLDSAAPAAADRTPVRRTAHRGVPRTWATEEAASRDRRSAEEREHEPADVLSRFREGTAEERITALAAMQADRALRDVDAAVTAVEDPRSPLEQHQALLLAAHMADDLDEAQARRLADAVRAQRDRRFRRDSDLWRLAEAILRRLEAGRPQDG